MGSLNTEGSVPYHKVVCLDAVLCPVPKFDFPHEYVEYQNTIGEDLIIERLKDATIAISTRAPISERTLSFCPRLEFISLMSAGADIIDLKTCRKRKITVCNSPSASAESVAEHGFALYFAAKRRVVDMHEVAMKGEEWPRAKNCFHLYPILPRLSRNEVLGIVGYGGIGKHMERIGRGLGMSILIAERKGVPADSVRPGRIPFGDVFKKCTVLMLACPLTEESRNMITEQEIRSMDSSAIIVNVGRGGVVEEKLLARALQEKWIQSAATDVFTVEPADHSSSCLISSSVPNLTISPHVAWYADASLENLQVMVKSNLDNYLRGKPQNLVSGSWSVLEEAEQCS